MFFEFSLPMIIISVVVAITLRVADIVKNKKEFSLYKELIALSFIIYILLFIPSCYFSRQ